MFGMFAGFLMTWVYVVARGRGRASLMPRPWILFMFVAFIVVMGFDGTNATLFDMNHLGAMVPYLYEPRNDVRALTGFLSGIGMAGLALPVMNYMLWRAPEQEPLLATAWDFVALLGLQFVLLGIETSGSGLFLYPLAILGMLGTIATLNCLNSVVALSFFPKLRAGTWRETLNALVAATLITAIQLGLLSALRYAVLGTATLP
jgi:hypothetical protein